MSLSEKRREGQGWEQIQFHSNDLFVGESEFTKKYEGCVTYRERCSVNAWLDPLLPKPSCCVSPTWAGAHMQECAWVCPGEVLLSKNN